MAGPETGRQAVQTDPSWGFSNRLWRAHSTASVCGNALLEAWYRVNVKSPLSAPSRKPRALSAGMLVGTRFQPALLAAIDDWRKAQPDLPTRPEAVRRLVEIGLLQTGSTPSVDSVTGLPVDLFTGGDQA